MRSFVLVAMLAGCTATTAQQNDVQALCQIECDCGLASTQGADCPASCVSSFGGSTIPDGCMPCIYEYQHECSVIEEVCSSDCFAMEPPPQGGR